ncbi:phosphatidylinositol transfer protein csr1 [Coemansia guatemalensis]|uniref:Phosphatidylinositol transfer protein csr1 n=1 Tax=Coemansia guatemalensis TaxID=2761395 RepID=A0A9W8HTJ8_9FUNG|nr:phosphatidylinositol transfer protein csr1 [Coemansia guatemalensis]
MTITQDSVIQEYKTRTRAVSECIGHLTPEENQKLAQLWSLLLDYFEANTRKQVEVHSELLQQRCHDWSELGADDGLSDDDPEEVTQRAWTFTKGDSSMRKLGMLASIRKKPKPDHERLVLERHVSETTQQFCNRKCGRHVSLIPATYFPSFAYPDGETRNISDVFWMACSAKEHPDIWVCRFLRSTHWDVAKAFSAIQSTVEWRAAEALDQLNWEGEIALGYDELRLGIIQLVGRDKLGYPLLHFRVRRIMPRAAEIFAHKRYLVSHFEMLQHVIRKDERVTMLFDFTGFSMDNTPFNMVHFLVTLGTKQYAETSSMLILLVDSWLFTNFWNLIRPFLDANLSARIVFAKTIDDVLNFVDKDQLPEELGGQSTFATKFVLPREGENKAMTDLVNRKHAEENWRECISVFKEATRKWHRQVANSDSKACVDARDNAAHELGLAEHKLSIYTRARSNFERLGLVNEDGCLDLSQ